MSQFWWVTKALLAWCLAMVLLSRALFGAVTAGRLPGETITNEKGSTLQYNVCGDIFAIERRRAPACKKSRVIQTAIIGQPRRLNFGRMMQWNERWTVDRCGAAVIYLIQFDFRGSVGRYKIEPPNA
jgi:hypothetical protein